MIVTCRTRSPTARTSLTSAAGTQTYAYDDAGRLAATTDAAGAATSYTYDARGRVGREWHANGLYTDYGRATA